MSNIYHNQSSNLHVPQSWIKIDGLEASEVNDQGTPWNEAVDRGAKYQWIAKYEEHYGVLARISRAALGVLFTLTVVTIAFQSGRTFIKGLFFDSVKHIHIVRKELGYVPKGEMIDLYVSMAGNPVHMGHMNMVALAVNRLVQEGYRVNQVKAALSDEAYLKEKVEGYNHEIKRHKSEPEYQGEKFRVFIPRAQRIDFLKAAIQQAKADNVFTQDLVIDYFDGDHQDDGRKVFHACGGDFVPKLNVAPERYKHAVIVTREEEKLEGVIEAHGNNFSRIIIKNGDKTSKYSSSKIQNGDLDQLPVSVRETFKKLNEEAQLNPILPAWSAPQASLAEVENEITHPIARGTRKATMEGFYITPLGTKISLRTGAQLQEGSRSISNTVLQDPALPKYEKTDIVVINQDCLQAAEEEIKGGATKVAVLLLSSPTEAGGGMHDIRNNGQEEDLCRRSDIFGFMWDQSHFMAKETMYNLVDVERAHQVDPSYLTMTNNRMIHVPQVTVFRAGKNENYTMLEQPFEVGMLVSPGLDRPRYEKVDGTTRYKRAEDEEQLRKLIMTQLKVAYDENYDTVILGAFGCGAFHNPPELIAEFYKQIIDTHFKGAFKKIVFAILDEKPDRHNPEGNFRPFQKCFN